MVTIRDDDRPRLPLAAPSNELGALPVWIISREDFVLHKLKAERAHDFIDVLSALNTKPYRWTVPT